MKTLALTNQKGGVGKTTSAVNLAAGLARRGHRILLIDLDPQSNLTRGLGLWDEGMPETTVYDVLRGEASVADAVVKREARNSDAVMHVLPASLNLSSAEIQLVGTFGRERILSEALATVEDFDVCLIDCPPSLGLLTVNALVAATDAVIPVQAEFYALAGVAQIVEAIKTVRRLNTTLQITGAFATGYDQRRRIHEESVQTMASYFGARLFDTRIRVDTKLSEAPSYGLTIFEHAPQSRGAEDYAHLAEELWTRLQNPLAS